MTDNQPFTRPYTQAWDQPLGQPAIQSKVQLYFCPLKQDACTSVQAEIIRSWLPADELSKVERYIQASARANGLMVRGYLRGILSLFALDTRIERNYIAPNDWHFVYGAKGKPALVEEQKVLTGIEFNISHSGDWLVIAMLIRDHTCASNVELGVDIERYRASTNIYPILNHYFTSQESEALLLLPESQQRNRFFDLWALKESYIKAKGLGLALSLKSFSFNLNNMTCRPLPLMDTGDIAHQLSVYDELVMSLHQDCLVTEAQGWRVFLGRLDDEYRFAVAIGTSDGSSAPVNSVIMPEAKSNINWEVSAQQISLTSMLSRLVHR